MGSVGKGISKAQGRRHQKHKGYYQHQYDRTATNKAVRLAKRLIDHPNDKAAVSRARLMSGTAVMAAANKLKDTVVHGPRGMEASLAIREATKG